VDVLTVEQGVEGCALLLKCSFMDKTRVNSFQGAASRSEVGFCLPRFCAVRGLADNLLQNSIKKLAPGQTEGAEKPQSG
jgi:hypothetical protein